MRDSWRHWPFGDPSSHWPLCFLGVLRDVILPRPGVCTYACSTGGHFLYFDKTRGQGRAGVRTGEKIKVTREQNLGYHRTAICFGEAPTSGSFCSLLHAHRVQYILWALVHATGLSLGTYGHSTRFQFKKAWATFFHLRVQSHLGIRSLEWLSSMDGHSLAFKGDQIWALCVPSPQAGRSIPESHTQEARLPEEV